MYLLTDSNFCVKCKYVPKPAMVQDYTRQMVYVDKPYCIINT